MTTDTSTMTYEPSASDLEAYNAMAVIYEDVPVAESRVAMLNRLAQEHGLFSPTDGVYLVWFRWLVINKKPQLTMMDNRPRIGALPFNPGSVRVQRVYEVRQAEHQQRLDLISHGLETHVFEILPGVQVAAVDTPCAFNARGLVCGQLIDSRIHYRVEVKQSAYDAAVRRAERTAADLGIPVPDVEFEEDITDRDKRNVGTHGDIGAVPDSHIEWVQQPVLDPNTGRQLYQWQPAVTSTRWVKRDLPPERINMDVPLMVGEYQVRVTTEVVAVEHTEPAGIKPVTQRVAVNTSIPRSYMNPEPQALGHYKYGRDNKPRLVEPVSLPINNPLGKGREYTATIIGLDGRKGGQVQRFDWQGDVLPSPFLEYDERRVGEVLPDGQEESGFDDWSKKDKAKWLVQQAIIRHRNPDFRDRLRRRLAEAGVKVKR